MLVFRPSMAEMTATEIAEIILAMRTKLLRIAIIVVAVWAVTFTYIADKVITKIEHDLLPRGANLILQYPLEGLILKLKISLIFGFVAALPYMVKLSYEALRDRTEILANLELTKTKVVKYASASIILFLVGVTYGYSLMLPLFLKFLYQSAASQGVLAYYSLAEFINFVVLMLTIFGLVFQMPLVMIFLVSNDLVKLDTVKYYRRHFYVVFFIIGAAITPPDVFTQAMVAVPMIVLFEFSILISRVFEKADQQADQQSSEPDMSFEI